jgi:hypothetical protein
MSDFGSLTLQYNTGTDSSPTWTGTAIAFGGTSGANELRWATSGATTTTPSATWPFLSRPASGVSAIPQLWAFSTDTSGQQVATYDGTNSKANVFRWSFDNAGTLVSAFTLTAYGDNTHAAASPGSQPGGQSGSPMINGSSDTSNTSYLKANAYGFGVDTSGTQQTPLSGAAGSSLSATSGAAGAATTASAAWLSSWQSLQATTQYIQDGAICKALTAGYWYFTLALYIGAGMSTGTLQPVLSLSYSFS